MQSTEKISMSVSGVFGYSRDAIRVKVKKSEGTRPPEYRKFSIDPQITTFEVLQSIIAKAFELKGDFTVCYRVIDDYGQEAFLPLLSDWDLDAAFLSASEPCLTLQVDMKSCDEGSENWESYGNPGFQPPKDVFGTIEIPRSQISEAKTQNKLPGLFMNRMEKTLNIFQRALNLVDDQLMQPHRLPLTDADFRKFLDPIGQLNHSQELRSVIYYGGIEPSLRKVVWKHILNVYPDGMSGKQRMDYMKKKSFEYEELRKTWRDLLHKGQSCEELAYVTSMVMKDVLRTDRHLKFYAGSDDNQNIASLFNILTTYALNHPTVSYCQGMSDLASPLLVTMGDEAHAYICFCALMQRLKPNFMIDGITMTLKFQHLTEGLIYYDPEFHAYLKSHQAEDLLFCYRWLLLEMKREFAFDDALHMLEVLWSSLPSLPPENELILFEAKFNSLSPGLTPPPISPLLKTPRENPYTKVCALRRQSSSFSLNSVGSSKPCKKLSHRQNQSLDESILARQNRFRTQGNLKPFSSLDDNSVQLFNLAPAPKSRSISPMNTHSDGDSLAVKKRSINLKSHRGEFLSSSTGNLLETSNKRYFPRRLLSDKSDSAVNELKEETSQNENDNEEALSKKPNTRLVKNLNEFLNFSSKSRLLPVQCRQRSQCNSISENEDRESGVDEVGSDVAQYDGESSSPNSIRSPSSPSVFERKDDSSSPDDSEYYPMTTSITRELKLELENLDRQVFGTKTQKLQKKEQFRNVEVNIVETEDSSVKECASLQESKTEVEVQLNKKTEGDVFVWENPLGMPTTPDEQNDLEFDFNVESNEVFSDPQAVTADVKRRMIASVSDDDSSEWSANVSSTSNAEQKAALVNDSQKIHINQNGFAVTSAEEATEISSNFLKSANINAASLLNSLRPVNAVTSMLKSPVRVQRHSLPPPHEFGGGNAFLMFLCLTLLRQHRDYIIRSGLDYNEMAMHFDKMVRKHNVSTVLDQARQMYAGYLKEHSMRKNSAEVDLRV